MAYKIGSNLLSAFMADYSIAVFGLSLVIQSIMLIPVSMAGVFVLEETRNGWLWQWLSLAMLQKWWLWLWNAGSLVLLMGIPFAVAVVESREYRHVAAVRMFTIVFTKLVRPISRFGFGRLLIALAALTLAYAVALMAGYLESWNLTGWIDFVNLIVLGGIACLSILCIPLGFVAAVSDFCASFSSSRTSFLEQQRRDINRQILQLEESLADFRSELGQDSTPISSKSMRSRLTELRLHSTELDEELHSAREPLIIRIGRNVLCLLLVICLFHFLFTFVSSFWRFATSELLWYLPGVQTIDWLLLKVASTVKLVEQPKAIQPSFLRAFSTACLASIIFSVLFACGLFRLVSRRKGTLPPPPPPPSSRSVLYFSMYRTRRLFSPQSVDRFLAKCATLLCCFLFAAPIILFSGTLDSMEALAMKGVKLCPYVTVFATLLPISHRQIITSLHMVTFLRFPLLVWFIFCYRLALVLALLFVAVRSIRPIMRSFREMLSWRRSRTPIHLHLD